MKKGIIIAIACLVLLASCFDGNSSKNTEKTEAHSYLAEITTVNPIDSLESIVEKPDSETTGPVVVDTVTDSDEYISGDDLTLFQDETTHADGFSGTVINQTEEDTKEQASREAAAREKASREAAEAEAKEQASREAAEAAAREQASREAAEAAAREKASREAAEAAAREQASREAAEAAAREKASREASEAAAREQASREAAEAAAREQASREAAEAAAREKASREAAEAAAREKASREAAEAAAKNQQSGADYIANTNTGKFHYPYCSSVDKMSEANKWYFHGNRQTLIDLGYEPCKRCNP